MPSKTLNEQDGNSCAAHCTVISVNEINNAALTQHFAEKTLWPAIQFVDQGGVTSVLAAAKNSDPRLIVEEVMSRWPTLKVKLLCDGVQKTAAMHYVNTGMRAGMDALYKLLASDAVEAPLRLDDFVFYNCSFTMHNGAKPTDANFTGMHNILVTYESGKVYYYNPNESVPAWKITADWKKLEGQNAGKHSYVYSGVSVAMFR